MTYLNGIDVSKWQPTTPSLAGLSFAFARATYATTVDPKYAMHVRNFRRAGIVVGAYHFGVGHKPIHEQVRTFLAAAKGADLYVLDLERDTTQTMTQAEAREFIRLVHATGKKIGLYHSRSGFPELGQDYNWVAQWRKEPPTGIKWHFWQWQGSPLDRDKFSGTKAQLLALAGRAPIAPKEEPVTTGNRLTDAIVTRAGYLANELKAGDTEGATLQGTKIIEFAARAIGSVAPAVAAEPLSPTAQRAIAENPAWGILNEIGFSPDKYVVYTSEGVMVSAIDPVSIMAAANEQQERELALLGVFGQPGTNPDIDYSLFEQYYEPMPGFPGSWQPKAEYANTGTWQAYLKSKG